MKHFVFAVCVTLATATDHEWEAFKLRYGKQYSHTEEITRYDIFKNNSDFVKQHNEKAAMGEHTFFVEMNEFGDMTNEEFRSLRLGKLETTRLNNKTQHARERVIRSAVPSSSLKVPDAVDWRKLGAVTDVKSQAYCDSSWAFSATGSLEGQHFLATGELVSLSEQNLVDCSWMNDGCNGGNSTLAFQYIISNGGIDTEECYPYTAKDVQNCKYSANCIGATMSNVHAITGEDEEALKQAVATVGPISVVIRADSNFFRFYVAGIHDDPGCGSDNLNHAVLVVGYGIGYIQDYWIVKNSWGKEWGDNGYIKMARNKRNQCGIASNPVYPIL